MDLSSGNSNLVWFRNPSKTIVWLGHWLQIPNIFKCAIYVSIVGIITVEKKTKVLELNEWVNAMLEIASYECMLSRMSSDQEDRVSHWDQFWTEMEDSSQWISVSSLTMWSCSTRYIVVIFFLDLFIQIDWIYVLESVSIIHMAHNALCVLALWKQ